jgi:hypothetical protein
MPTLGFCGVTAIDVNVAATVTVIVAESVSAALPVPLVAVITAVCPFVAVEVVVTSPVFAPTVATAVLPLLQVTVLVIALEVLSEYVPVAESCTTELRPRVATFGVTVIDFSVTPPPPLPLPPQAASNNVDAITAKTTCIILLRASNIAFLSDI